MFYQKRLLNKSGFKRIVPCLKHAENSVLMHSNFVFGFRAIYHHFGVKTWKSLSKKQLNVFTFLWISARLPKWGGHLGWEEGLSTSSYYKRQRLSTVRYLRHIYIIYLIYRLAYFTYIWFVDIYSNFCLVFVWFAIWRQKLNLSSPRTGRQLKSSPPHDQVLPFQHLHTAMTKIKHSQISQAYTAVTNGPVSCKIPWRFVRRETVFYQCGPDLWTLNLFVVPRLVGCTSVTL